MNRDAFELHKFKVDKNGRLEATYSIMHTDGDTAHAEVYTMSSRRITHPDLRDALDELRYTVAEANDLMPYRHIKCAPSKQQHLDKLAKEFNKLDAEVVDAITVTGLSLKGSIEGTNDKRAVVITAKRDIKGKDRERHTAVAMNTPKIMLNADVFGFEDSLAQDIDKLTEEVYLYIVERKSNQLALDLDDTEEMGEPVPAGTLDS